MNPTLSMHDNQEDVISANPLDAAGNPTTDSKLAWSVDDPSMLDLVPSSDSLSCVVKAKGKVGTCHVTASDGTLSATVDVTITAAAPASLNLTTGVPQDIPPAVSPSPSPAPGQ